jgi:hypothetical protein
LEVVLESEQGKAAQKKEKEKKRFPSFLEFYLSIFFLKSAST